MPSTLCQDYAAPDTRDAWLKLETSLSYLEKVMRNADGAEPQIAGNVFYWEGDRVMCAPATSDGTPDKLQGLHRTEFKGMSIAEMLALRDAVDAWLDSLNHL